jgi:acyl-CoA dehydrogenase
MEGQDVVVETSMAKYSICEGLKTIVDECLQLFGGYGYMEEYPICKAYRDARVLPIFGGSSQIMKEIISRALLK